MTLDQRTIRRIREIRTPKGATSLAKTLECRGQIEEILSLREIKTEIIPSLVGELFEREGLGGLRRIIEFGANAASRREAIQRFVSEVRKKSAIAENGFFLAGVHYLNHGRNPKTGRIDLDNVRDLEIDDLVGKVLCENGLAKRLVEEYHESELDRVPIGKRREREEELIGRYQKRYLD